MICGRINTLISPIGYKMVRWIILILTISAVLVVWSSPTPDDDWRANWDALRYISTAGGRVYDCPSEGCNWLVQFGEGQPLIIIGAVGRDGVMWYVVDVGDGVEGFVRADIMRYESFLNVTPTPDPRDRPPLDATYGA